MSWLSGLTDLIGKGMDKIWPDKEKCREQQTELNKLEIQGAPQSRVRLWRSYLMIVCMAVLGYVVIVQPVLVFYFPGIKLPTVAEPVVEAMVKLLFIGVGGAF